MSGTRAGRTYFWAKDAAWWRRERIVLLGREFGSAGPAVIDWLSCEAKAQNDGGWVKSGPTAVGVGCFVDPEVVCPVLSRSVLLGLVEDYKEADGLFTCRISGWKADQETIAERLKKRDQRASRSPVSEESVPDGPVLSPPVPNCPEKSPTGQDKTEENNNPPNPPQAGGRQRDHRAFDEEVQTYTLEVLGITHEDGWQNVRAAIKSGGAKTSDDVLAWIEKWRPDLLSTEAAA